MLYYFRARCSSAVDSAEKLPNSSGRISCDTVRESNRHGNKHLNVENIWTKWPNFCFSPCGRQEDQVESLICVRAEIVPVSLVK